MNLPFYRHEIQQNVQTFKKSILLKTVRNGLLFSIAFIVLMGLDISPALSTPKDKPIFPVISLPEKAQGEKAIRAIAEKLPEVAKWYGTTPQQFATMLRLDHTAWIDTKGRLFFIEEFPEPTVEDELPTLASGLFPYEQTFKLHSRPGSKRVLFLDFDGHTISGTAWNNSYGDPINAQAYDLDGNPSSFTNNEMDRIQNVWQRVAEDYAPFDVDVTTEDPSQDAITRSSNSDDRYGTRVVMTVDDFASCGCGGFAYVGVFDSVGDYYKPAFVFNTSEIGVAEAVSHEAGHNLGLSHDGIIGGATYYSGHGNGDTGWAPIMGVGYNKQLVQWSKGEYAAANQTQDDIQIIQDNGVPLMADDHGDDQTTATTLNRTSDGITVTLSGMGLIERRTDVDFFRFMSGNGNIAINISPDMLSPNLDIHAELYDANGFLIANSNPVDSLTASFNEASMSAGEYFIMIQGVGKGDPLAIGYTDYASLGKYTISGSVSDPGGLLFPIAVASADPPLSGYAPFTVNFRGDGSNDSDGSIVSYDWNFGDGSVSSPNINPTYTYYAPGTYTATLTVTDNDGLTNSDTVNIVVENKAPIAEITAEPTSGTAPMTVSFDSTGSKDPDEPYGVITDYLWDFGDGNTSTAANPSHTYGTAGSFTATLTVIDDLGDIGTSTIMISASSPPVLDQYATNETYVSGTVTGSYTDTFSNDGIMETIRERESGGKPRNRYSYLEHIWVIPVQAGNSVMLFINAWQSDSNDDDNFLFDYSSDGGATYRTALIISNITDEGVVAVPLPPDTQGNILIRVRDQNRDRGNRSLDTIFVDELYISTESQSGSPPAVPTGLNANAVSSGQVDLSWTDNAIDEYGFHIERSTDGGGLWHLITTVSNDSQTYIDIEVTQNSTYWYRVSAYNGSGQSGYAGPVVVTTPDNPVDIVLLANGYKDKGTKKVDLIWSGLTTSDVEIYRNSILIDTTSSTGTYTDNIGKGGGGSYTYQICDPSNTSNCSNSVTVNF